MCPTICAGPSWSKLSTRDQSSCLFVYSFRQGKMFPKLVEWKLWNTTTVKYLQIHSAKLCGMQLYSKNSEGTRGSSTHFVAASSTCGNISYSEAYAPIRCHSGKEKRKDRL